MRRAWLAVVLAGGVAYGGMVDGPDPVDMQRAQTECTRRCEVRDARGRGVCEQRCLDALLGHEVSGATALIWPEDRGWMSRHRAARTAAAPCENRWACAGWSVCGEGRGAVVMQMWRDHQDGQGPIPSTTTCTAFCASGRVYQSTCEGEDGLGCTLLDWQPGGACWQGPMQPDEPDCASDPAGCS